VGAVEEIDGNELTRPRDMRRTMPSGGDGRVLAGTGGFNPDDEQALVERIDALESVLRGLLAATDGLTHLEGAPKVIADLSVWRLRARSLLARDQ
jgi:hypothetical protein